MSRTLNLSTAVLTLTLVLAGSTIAQDTDCLSSEYLAAGGLEIAATHPETGAAGATARSVAEAETLTGEAARAILVDLAMGPAHQRLNRVYLVEIAQDSTPHQLAGSATGPSVVVTTPCAVVVTDESGDYLFTYSLAIPVENP